MLLPTPRHPAPFPAAVSYLDDVDSTRTRRAIAIPTQGVALILHVPDVDRDRPQVEPILSISEQTRLARIQHPRAFAEFLAGRLMIRTTLGRLLGIDPAAVVLHESPRGALSLDPSHQIPDLHFNLSHTDGLIALAVSRHQVGVDVEWLDRRGQTVEIANRYFAKAELETLRGLPKDQHRDRFFDLWTLKEAYIKARGLGLAMPLGSFAFAGFESPPITIAVEPAQADRPDSAWSFGTWDLPATHHRLAIALASI